MDRTFNESSDSAIQNAFDQTGADSVSTSEADMRLSVAAVYLATSILGTPASVLGIPLRKRIASR